LASLFSRRISINRIDVSMAPNLNVFFFLLARRMLYLLDVTVEAKQKEAEIMKS
jgi:hypothetical protein